MKILVTGGLGFMGSNFIRYMLDKYPDYEIVNLDKVTYAGNPENLEPISVDNFLFGYLVTEYSLTDKMRALAQLSFMEGPFRNNDLKGLDENPMDLLIGAGYRLEDFNLEFGFTQDLTRVAPEFGFNIGVHWKI